MICEECKKKGAKSTISVLGARRTLLGSSPFYDEEGKWHDHDPNTKMISYRCSRGHEWSERTKSSCWCGWPNKRDEASTQGGETG